MMRKRVPRRGGARGGGGGGGSTKSTSLVSEGKEQAVGMTSSYNSNSLSLHQFDSVKQFYTNRNYLKELYSSLMDLDRQKQCLKKRK